MKKLFYVLTLALTCFQATAQKDSLVTYVNPPALPTPVGYSHAAVVDLGNCKMVIMSGQVPLDNKGNLIGKGDFTQQAEQVFSNINQLVLANGGTMNDIVKITVFVTGDNLLIPFRNVRNKYINTKNPPASSFVQVQKLYREEVMVEVEATAIIPKKN